MKISFSKLIKNATIRKVFTKFSKSAIENSRFSSRRFPCKNRIVPDLFMKNTPKPQPPHFNLVLLNIPHRISLPWTIRRETERKNPQRNLGEVCDRAHATDPISLRPYIMDSRKNKFVFYAQIEKQNWKGNCNKTGSSTPRFSCCFCISF